MHNIFTDWRFLVRFFRKPASIRNHDSGRVGLAKHTLDVAENVLHLSRYKSKQFQDIAVAGALLHDIGKIIAYKKHKNAQHYYCPYINLVGHKYAGIKLFEKLTNKYDILPFKYKIIILNILQGQHSTDYDYNMTEEAFYVKEADKLAAKMSVDFCSNSGVEYNKYLNRFVTSSELYLNKDYFPNILI